MNYFLIFSILILFIILTGIFRKNKIERSPEKYNLQKDGFTIIKNALSNDEIKTLKNYSDDNNYKNIKESIINNQNILSSLQKLSNNNYIFQDYIWVIKKSSVHTCHRDNNGSFFNKGQKYPSYTILIYLEDMDKCLGVIPKSHLDINNNNTNFKNCIIDLLCNKGDIIIFDANLIHVGTINNNNNNLRIQMKFTHKDDIETLNYYQDFNKILDQENTIPKELLKFQKNLSCLVPYIANLSQKENIKSSRGTSNGAKISTIQKWFSYIFYGNSNYYDLPNAF